MGAWEDLLHVGEDVSNVGNGIRSGIEDVPGLIGNVLQGDLHGVATDGRKLIGDVGDVLDGVGHLGVTLGKISTKYAGSLGKLADSPILSAAQLAIEAERKTTGDGDPEEGDGYSQSAKRLDECIETYLKYADPLEDRWDGSAAAQYHDTSSAHRGQVSNVQTADQHIGEILATEAGQVSRARRTLDETSQYLYDYGLATAYLNVIPGANVAKAMADMAAASAALGTTNTTMTILVMNSRDNARQISQWQDQYTNAAKDTSGGGGICGTFVDPKDDIDPKTRPTRLDPDQPYEVPSPEDPGQHGPPATPYDSPAG